MIYDVEKRIVALRNELQSQKVSSGIAYSQLLLPRNTPILSYYGTASWTNSTTAPIARLRFRFSRTDGQLDPPLINFTHLSYCTPTYKEYAIDNGLSFSPNVDMGYQDSSVIEGYIAELGDGYVDFYVDFGAKIMKNYFSLDSIGIRSTCQVISNVYGELSVERLK